MVETAARASSQQRGAGLFLPPGFRFHPTHEEVVMAYLLPKVLDTSFVSLAVGEVNLNSCEPRELPEKAAMGEKEWYFFVHKDMKYPTGMRANRATREGYWKATGNDKEIVSAAAGELVGMKKTLVFYTGRAPRGGKTNWVMHEFRLDGKSKEQIINNPKDEWVVCKVFNKKGEGEIMPRNPGAGDNGALYSAGTTPDVSSVDVDAGDNGALYSAGTTPDASFVAVDAGDNGALFSAGTTPDTTSVDVHAGDNGALYSAWTTPDVSSVAGDAGDNGALYSDGTTPDASFVDVNAADVGDFLDSMLDDPFYFDNYMSSPPPANTTTANTTGPTAAPPQTVNVDYYNYSVPTTDGISFNVDMPNYSLTNTASSTQTQAAAVAAMVTGSAPTSSYMLNTPAAHGMGRSYNANQLHLPAIIAKTLGGVIGTSDHGVPAANAPAITGRLGTVPRQRKVGSYDGGEYAYGNYDAAMNDQSAAPTCAKNFDGRQLNY